VKPDVIVCWPRNCDYPLWRAFLRAERSRFGEVYIVFTELGIADYRDFVRSQVDATCLDSPERDGRDWRDVAVNAALDRSSAERVWFTEQDFLITDPERFWPQVRGPLSGIDVGDTRPLHPACLFASRDLIERTGRYFGTPPVDHFYTFGTELVALAKPHLILSGWRHDQGTSQNHTLLERGEEAGINRRERYRRYLADCLRAGVPLQPDWAARARAEIDRSAHL
jgi:hypothetical protein